MATKKTTKKKTAKATPVAVEATSKKAVCCTPKGMSCDKGGCAYALGFLGAAIYYISVTSGFWPGLLGVLKAAVWPVFLVHGLLKFIGA